MVTIMIIIQIIYFHSYMLKYIT